MKHFLTLMIAILASSAFAKDLEINCEAAKKTDTLVYVNLHRLDFEAAKTSYYDLTIVNSNTNRYGVVSDVQSVAISGRDLQAVPYKGRKYVGHLKFPLTNKNATTAGSFNPESADLILSPEYKVVKTIHEQNNWDKTWTWDVEVRKHSAVLAAHFDDHHGDYIELNCYSLGHVNDSKHRP